MLLTPSCLLFWLRLLLTNSAPPKKDTFVGIVSLKMCLDWSAFKRCDCIIFAWGLDSWGVDSGDFFFLLVCIQLWIHRFNTCDYSFLLLFHITGSLPEAQTCTLSVSANSFPATNGQSKQLWLRTGVSGGTAAHRRENKTQCDF